MLVNVTILLAIWQCFPKCERKCLGSLRLCLSFLLDVEHDTLITANQCIVSWQGIVMYFAGFLHQAYSTSL
jgi:hypothetical protein